MLYLPTLLKPNLRKKIMIEAMKQALEALEQYHGYMEPLTTVFGGPRVPAEQSTTGKVDRAITALRQALEQQPADEPVAWVCEGFSSDEKHAIDYWQGDVDDLPIGTQLYATLPKRKPLTDEEIEACLHHVDENGIGLFAFARAIEAAHGIKENT